MTYDELNDLAEEILLEKTAARGKHARRKAAQTARAAGTMAPHDSGSKPASSPAPAGGSSASSIGDAAGEASKRNKARLEELASHATQESPSRRARATARLERIQKGRSVKDRIGHAARRAVKAAPGMVKKHWGKGLAAAAGTVAVHQAVKHFGGEKRASALDTLAMARAYEILAESGIEAELE
jgi:ElaB/YqjD/DUF883 family membrane-anchored ribosome-binding protein